MCANLARIDDRYLIANAGDELSLRFPEQPPPPAGGCATLYSWATAGSRTAIIRLFPRQCCLCHITPARIHCLPGALEDEWVYKQSWDWQKYHTRYITPDVFRNALQSRQR